MDTWPGEGSWNRTLDVDAALPENASVLEDELELSLLTIEPGHGPADISQDSSPEVEDQQGSPLDAPIGVKINKANDHWGCRDTAASLWQRAAANEARD